jgi:hypothetical protein
MEHINHQIKLELCQQHKTLCLEYKNVTLLEEVGIHYAIIWRWWYSLGVVDASRL